MTSPLDENIKIFKRTMIYFIIGGITLVIALSWNTAFSNLIQKIFPNKSTNVIGHFLHAIILTLIFVVVSLLFIDPTYLADFTFFKVGSAPIKEEKKPTPNSSNIKTTESYKPNVFEISF